MTEATENWYESATRCALLFALTIGLQAQSSPSLPSLSDAKRFSSDKPWREKTLSGLHPYCGGREVGARIRYGIALNKHELRPLDR
jgi:hypothetical protein